MKQDVRPLEKGAGLLLAALGWQPHTDCGYTVGTLSMVHQSHMAEQFAGRHSDSVPEP
jgi:hypothetical protein